MGPHLAIQTGRRGVRYFDVTSFCFEPLPCEVPIACLNHQQIEAAKTSEQRYSQVVRRAPAK